MWKYVWVLIGFALGIQHLQAQQVILDEQFMDNRRNWDLVADKRLDSKLGEGMFHIRGRSKSTGSIFGQKVILAKSQDYNMTLEIIHTGGAKNMGYGLVWGAKFNQQDYYAFLISANGKFTILQRERGQFSQIKPWTSSKHILKSKKPNVLSIEKRGEDLHFFINGYKVFSSAAERMRGNLSGILCFGSIKLSANRFMVTLPVPEEETGESGETGEPLEATSEQESARSDG
ncbi:hypothetical protein [Pontibacter sp. G13]|uniref:hypothetical protein n=1 Tax=Pontibacter sp. G13 TaxID=3074898 RepID=UPI00288A75E7|nr:hypothetical protein [Pontibacter sp. G13]WNJ16880.1 hypothetical protein RJD25_18605 [Pontibacter sp. G13]